MENLIKVNVINKDGKLVVSSREVAENFGKTHSHVLRDLDKIVSEEPSLVSQIILSSYKTEGNNKTYKEYLLTEKGFTLYMFNIQGYNEFKLAYIEEFDRMKEYIKTQKPQLSPQEQLALQLFNGGIDAITAHKQLLELETKELNKTIEAQGETIKEQKPFVDIALERIAKGECLSLTDINTGMNIVRGRLTKWAKEKGYLHKTQTEVNELGRKYFKVYINGKYKSIGVTKEGVKLINDNLEEIRNFGVKKNKGGKKIKF